MNALHLLFLVTSNIQVKCTCINFKLLASKHVTCKIFKPGEGQHAWFLEIAFVCKVDVCVSAPEDINNYSREMNP